MDAVGSAENPHPQAADHDGEQRDDQEVADAAQQDQPAQDDERARIAQQVHPTDVQQRRRQNAPQAGDIARLDAEAIERATIRHFVDQFDEPGEQHAAEQDRRLHLGGAFYVAHHLCTEPTLTGPRFGMLLAPGVAGFVD